jgi:hypothetical protein
MGLISKSKTWVDNENLLYTDLNTMFTSLYNLVNGSIQNANVASDAAIVESKVSFNTSTGHSHDGVDSKQIKSIAQIERARYGVLQTGTNVCPRWYNKTGQSLTTSGIFIYSETAPTGADLIVDVNIDGTTMFTTQGNRPTIEATENSGTSGTPDVTTIADGSYLTFDIDQVGSTIPGADLVIIVLF